MRTRAVSWLLAACVPFVCARAHASGFSSQQGYGEHSNVTEWTPLAIYYNPGALALSEGLQLGLYGTLALRHATWTHPQANDDYPDPADAHGADTGRATLFNVFGGPTIAGSLQLTKDLVVAGGLFAPFYGSFSWDKNDAFAHSAKYPLAADGVQRWFAIEGDVAVYYGSLGVAYRLGPLGLGVSGNLSNSMLTLTQARNIGGVGRPDVTQEGRGRLDVEGLNASFGAGVLWEILPKQLYLGASYQARPGLGEQKLTGTLDVSMPGQPASRSHVTLHQTLPDVIRLGARLRPKQTRPEWELRLFGDYTRWSALTQQCIALGDSACAVSANGAAAAGASVLANVRRNWNDTWSAHLGASYWLTASLEAYVGTGYETSAVPASTLAPDVPDASKISGLIGARLAMTEHVFLSLSYTHVQYQTRDVSTTRSTLATSPSGAPYVYPTVEGNGGGRYTQWLGMLAANVELEL
jgi:long-chain fatty acid transport protein